MNKVILQGNVGQDAEVRKSNSGMHIVNFSLATNENRKKDDKWESITTWHRVVLFDKLAEWNHDKLVKGVPILLEGKISNGSYENKDGVKMYTSEIIGNYVRVLVKNENAEQDKGNGSQHVPASSQNLPFDDDDIPF